MEMTAKPTLKAYAIGYVASLVTTLAAYLVVKSGMTSRPLLSHDIIPPLIIALALAQFVVQLIFFLHLGRETRPRWKLLVFIFMIMIVCILVFGSLWIMQHLNYNMNLTPQDTDSVI